MLTVPDGTGENFSTNIDWVACNIGEYEESEWNSVRRKAAKYGIVAMPWLRLARSPDDGETVIKDNLRTLVETARSWNVNFILPNYEKEAEWCEPNTVAALLKGTGWKGNTGWSMQGWLPNDVDYSPINDDPVLLQIFPEDLKWDVDDIPSKMSDCVYHARVDHGFMYCGVTYQSYRDAEASWYDCEIDHSVFTGNTISPEDWKDWFPQ
jgi:hypothetical protein